MKCRRFRQFSRIAVVMALTLLAPRTTLAQAAAPVESAYRSAEDELLSIDRVSVLPFSDNLQGIYARPLESHFIELIEKMHRWDFVPAKGSGPLVTPEDLEVSVDKAKQVSQGMGADGFFACRVSKGPNGVLIHLSLFLTKDGKLLSQAILKDYSRFDLPSLKEQLERMLSEVVNRLPYSGRVLSRDGNRVTVNLGAKDGIQVGQMLSAVQIIQSQRHPRFNFLIRTEKEIFGKIKILKVDDTLSFGVVLSEKEKSAVAKNSKIGSLDGVSYAGQESLSPGSTPEEALLEKDDGRIVFGKDARAWQPEKPPMFGQVGGRLGLGRFRAGTNLSSVGGLEAVDNYAPSVQIDGEIWVTPTWTFFAGLRQGIMTTPNPRTGSDPGRLTFAMTYYEAGFGYDLRLGPYVWSPKIQPFFGYFNYENIADISTPSTYSSVTFTGMKFGVKGVTPIGPGGDYGAGAIFSTAFQPRLKEYPAESGTSPTNSIVQFGVFGFKRYSQRLRFQMNLDMEVYSVNWSGAGSAATSASQSLTTLSGGVYYLF